MDQQLSEVVIVGDDGTEHVFPAGFDPKQAARIVRRAAGDAGAAAAQSRAQSQADAVKPVSLGSVGAGLVRGVKAANPIPFLKGVAENVSPADAAFPVGGPLVLAMGRALYQGAVRTAGKAKEAFGKGHYTEAAAHGVAAAIPGVGPIASQLGEQAQTDPGGAIGESAAMLATPYAGRVLTKVAPAVYETGLGRTAAMKRLWKGVDVAGRGVKEGIIATPGRVRPALASAESDVQKLVTAYDAQRPNVRGYLPEATRQVPLGETPTPIGGVPAVVHAKPLMMRRQNESRRLQGMQLGDPLDTIYSSERLKWELPDLPRADAVEGAGTVGQRIPPRAGRGAPPTMIDPRDIVNRANTWAAQKSKLNNAAVQAPGREQLAGLTDQFLQEHQSPMTAAQTLALKRAEDLRGRGAYNAQAAAAPGTGTMEQLWHQGNQQGAREALVDKIPEVAAPLTREQELLGLLRASEHAGVVPAALRHYLAITGAGAGLATGHIPTGVATAAAIELIRDPRAMSALAITLDRTGKIVNPAMVRSAILANLNAQPDESPQP